MLEFLLGQYCSSDDEAIIEKGVQNVKRILADNFVRPDEAQKILSQLRKKGSHTVIDMITVNLDIKKNCFFASFSNLGLDKVPIADEYPEKYDRLLCGGIWLEISSQRFLHPVFRSFQSEDQQYDLFTGFLPERCGKCKP